MNPEAELALSLAAVAIGRRTVAQFHVDLERLLFIELIPAAAAGQCSEEFQDLLVNLYSELSEGNKDRAVATRAFHKAIRIPGIVEHCPLEATVYALEQVKAGGQLDGRNAKRLVVMPWALASAEVVGRLKFKINEFAGNLDSFTHEVNEGFVDPTYNDKELFLRGNELVSELRTVMEDLGADRE